MSRILDLFKGLLAVAALVALVVGVPYALLTYAGDPISGIRQIVSGELLSDNTRVSLALRSGLTIVAWLAWLQVTLSVLVETIALVRGRVAGRAPVLPGVQGFARRLVVTSTLLVNAFTSTTTTAATLMPLAVPPPAETVEVDLLTPLATDGPRVELFEQAVGPIYTAVAGDTFWSLAEATLGDGLRWSEIRELNLGRTMADGTVVAETTEVVRSGWELVLPADAVLPLDVGGSDVAPIDGPPVALDVPPEVVIESARSIDPGPDADELLPDPGRVVGTWEVEKGDHFWAIAEETLTAFHGRPVTEDEIRPYWLAIIEANEDRLVTGDPDLIHPGQTFDVLLPPLVVGDVPTLDGEAFGRAEPSVGSGGGPAGTADGDGAPAQSEWTANGSEAGTANPPQLEPLDSAETESGAIDGSAIPLGLLGTAVGAGAMLEALRRRRRRAAVRRQPGESGQASGGPDAVARFEARLRPVADTEAVRWLAATNRFLSASLADQPDAAVPAVVAMRAGEFGVEVLLDDTCAAPSGFVDDGATGTAWRIDPDLDIDDVEAAGEDAQPFSPALLPIGETDAGDLLVDLEQLAVVSLVGDVGTIAGWMATLTTAATTMSWSQDCSIVAVGVQTVLGGSRQVVVPTDVDAWAAPLLAEMEADARRSGTSSYERRIGAGATQSPTVVLLGPGHDELAGRLAAVAELAHSPLVLVTTTELAGHARVELYPGRGVLVPDAEGLRIEFIPVTTGSMTARFAADLLASADPASGSGRHVDVYDTVKRRPLPAVNDIAEAAANQWPPPAAPSTPPATLPTPEETPGPAAPDATFEGSFGSSGSPGSAATPNGSPGSARSVAPTGPVPSAAGPDGGVPGSAGARSGPVSGMAALPEDHVPDSAAGNGRAEEPVMTATEITAERLRLLAPRSIETKILTAHPTVTGVDGLSSRAAAIVVYLATGRHESAAGLAAAFAMSGPEIAAVIAEIDDSLGSSADGDRRLIVDGDGHYSVGPDVGSDWLRLGALTALAARTVDTTIEMSCLESAVGLVDGPPALAAPAGDFGWLLYDHEVYSRIETQVVDAAHRLGDLALEVGNPELAAWAAAQGLVVVPGQEALHRTQMRAAAALDDAEGIEHSYRAAAKAAEELLVGDDELHPETERLYASLVDR